MKNQLSVTALILAVAGAVSSASAAQFTVATSLDNLAGTSNTMAVGSLVFSDWIYTGTANPAGLLIPASAITVSPTTLAGNSGVQFASGWNVATQANGTSAFQDSLISFTVTGPDLTDIHLLFNGGSTGNGVAGVSETYTIGSVTNALNVSTPNTFTDSNTFASTGSITVTKDIDVTSGVRNGDFASTASISNVTNTYSQGVPEPASLSILGLGLAGLGLRRVRRQK